MIHKCTQWSEVEYQAQGLSRLVVWLKTVGLEMTTSTHSNNWTETVPDFSSCNAEATGAE